MRTRPTRPDWAKPPEEGDFRSAAHHPVVTSRVGLWLGITFSICFVTGLLSHLIQHPPFWFDWPSRPVSLYRITQGLHVITGTAAVPLLLAKLWSVYPKLFSRPTVRSLVHALERGSILLLSGAAFFELVTGVFNMVQNYPWPFFFPVAHYAAAWIAIGSILLHVAVKLPVVRRGLAERPDRSATGPGLSRRAFLRTTWLTTGVAALAVAGGTVPWLRDVSVFSPRSVNGPQGLPVNKTAAAAGVHSRATDPGWQLELVGPAGTRKLTLAELNALPQVSAELPISCVEGWSASATWSGVRFTDLLPLVGARPGATVDVHSLERNGLYANSTLPGTHTSDPLTLLALRCNGSPLELDHGFPCRVIAPSRPGVLQTKWVGRLEVRS